MAATDFVPGGDAGDRSGILGSAGPTGPPRPAETAPALRPARPVAVGSGVMEARLVRRVEPAYPRIAVVAHLSGSVVLRAVIAKDGTVQSLRAESGSPILAAAALDAVRQWQYKPTLLNGEPVEVETLITVNFVLQ